MIQVVHTYVPGTQVGRRGRCVFFSLCCLHDYGSCSVITNTEYLVACFSYGAGSAPDSNQRSCTGRLSVGRGNRGNSDAVVVEWIQAGSD